MDCMARSSYSISQAVHFFDNLQHESNAAVSAFPGVLLQSADQWSQNERLDLGGLLCAGNIAPPAHVTPLAEAAWRKPLRAECLRR